MSLVASHGSTCNWDKKTQNTVASEGELATGRKNKIHVELQVKVGLAIGMKQTMVLVASREWTCNWDKYTELQYELQVKGTLATGTTRKNYDTSCESRVD